MAKPLIIRPELVIVDETCKLLSQKIKKNFGSVDVVVALLTGGVTPAMLIASHLGVSNIYSLGIRRYTGTKPTKRLTVYRELPDVCAIPNKRVLIVDDISDQGATLHVAEDLVRERMPRELKTCTLYVRRGSSFVPDFYYGIVDNIEGKPPYVKFPWESD